MKLREAIELALKKAGIPATEEEIPGQLQRYRDYARESMVMTLNRHDYTITKKVEVRDKRYRFKRGENQPYGRVVATQDGKICRCTFSRCDMDALIIEAHDGEAALTFKPTPIYPTTFEDKIDMPEEFLNEVVDGIAMYARMHRRNVEGGHHER